MKKRTRRYRDRCWRSTMRKLPRFVGLVRDEVEGGFDVRGCERPAVVEADATAKMENVSERIRDGPGFGEIAVEVHLIVTAKEAAEEKAVDTLGI